MAVAEETLTVYKSLQNGLELTTHFTQFSYDGTTLPDGSKFLNNGEVVLVARPSTSRVLTIHGQRKNQHGVLTKTVVTCASGVHVIGPFSTHHFNDAQGYCHIHWDGTSASDLVVAVKQGTAKE